MHPFTVCRMLSVLACSWLLAACATPEGGPSSSPTTASSAASATAAGGSALPTKATAVNAAAAAGRSLSAAGTEGDTLQACMGRIPKDASSGQRTMAEMTCQRDHAAQRSITLVPGGK